MSQNSCCVPGCVVVRKDGVPLHRFPNPKTSAQNFKTWILNIGGEITSMDHLSIYDNKRVCHRHFEEMYIYPTNRLAKTAIPVLNIPGKFVSKQSEPTSPSQPVSATELSAPCSAETSVIRQAKPTHDSQPVAAAVWFAASNSGGSHGCAVKADLEHNYSCISRPRQNVLHKDVTVRTSLYNTQLRSFHTTIKYLRNKLCLLFKKGMSSLFEQKTYLTATKKQYTSPKKYSIMLHFNS